MKTTYPCPAHNRVFSFCGDIQQGPEIKVRILSDFYWLGYGRCNVVIEDIATGILLVTDITNLTALPEVEA